MKLVDSKARKRIEFLVDPGSFFELDANVVHRGFGFSSQIKQHQGDGVVIGIGRVDGRLVGVFSQDVTFVGGSLGEMHGKKILKVMDFCEKNLCPLIGIVESGGARIHEGVLSLAAYAEIFYKNVKISGLVPQITVILGACAGGAVYSPALTDFIVMSKSSFMFITGPDVVEAVTGKKISKEELGGANIHDTVSGVVDLVGTDDEDCLKKVQSLLTFLPDNYLTEPPRVYVEDSPFRETPHVVKISNLTPSQPYDVRDAIRDIVDLDSFFELKPNFGKSIVIGFAALDGRSIGIVANNPAELAGCLDVESSVKAARFVRLCNSYNIPILTLVDVPGFLPGAEQEQRGIIKEGAKLLFAYCEATVPRVTLILKKAYGGAYDVMNSRHIGADFVFALPNSEIAVMGPEGACKVVFKKRLENESSSRTNVFQELVNEYRQDIANVRVAESLGFVDSVIDPSKTREVIIKSFRSLKRAQRRFAQKNIPL